MTSTKSFISSILSTIAVALGVVLLLGIALQPAMAKVRPVPPPPTPSCSFTSNGVDSLTLTATGLLARYPKAEAKTDVTVKLDGNTIISARIQSDSYVAIFTATGDYTATFKRTTSGAALKASCSGTIEDLALDTTPPVLTLPDDITLDATSLDGAEFTFEASATDDVDGALTPECFPVPGAVAIYPAGETTRVDCGAQDAAGNITMGFFYVTVNPYVAPDTTDPVLTLPENITVEATGPGTVVTWEATATDDVSGNVTAFCDPEPTSTFPLGQTTVHCSATDQAGNIGSGSFTVTVTDTTGPVFALPETIMLDATGPEGAVVTWEATATDAVDGDVDWFCNPASGYTETAGTARTVFCAAEDSHGNDTLGWFRVEVTHWDFPATCVWSIDPFTGGYSIRVDAVDLVEDQSSTFEVTRNGVLLFAPRVFTASGRVGMEDGTDAAVIDPVGSDSAPASGIYIASYTVSGTGQYQTQCHIIIP